MELLKSHGKHGANPKEKKGKAQWDHHVTSPFATRNPPLCSVVTEEQSSSTHRSGTGILQVYPRSQVEPVAKDATGNRRPKPASTQNQEFKHLQVSQELLVLRRIIGEKIRPQCQINRIQKPVRVRDPTLTYISFQAILTLSYFTHKLRVFIITITINTYTLLLEFCTFLNCEYSPDDMSAPQDREGAPALTHPVTHLTGT